MDYPLLTSPLPKPFNRVILVVTIGARPFVLFDGLITNQQLSGSSTPGGSTLTITGEDVSVVMDREERSFEHPAQGDAVVATKIIAAYPQYGLVPQVTQPANPTVPNPQRQVPTQQGTDLDHLRRMAERHGFVFYVMPGDAPGVNIAYWGPPSRTGPVQPSVTVNMGSASNVESINFQYDALAATVYDGEVLDSESGQRRPIRTFSGNRQPPLAAQPAHIADRAGLRQNKFRESGLDGSTAQSRAQARTDASSDHVLTATGELDANRYGNVLHPRGLVGLRGVGYSFDGLYYVKSVTHSLSRGQYRQQFSLTREGKGSTVPVLQP